MLALKICQKKAKKKRKNLWHIIKNKVNTIKSYKKQRIYWHPSSTAYKVLLQTKIKSSKTRPVKILRLRKKFKH